MTEAHLQDGRRKVMILGATNQDVAKVARLLESKDYTVVPQVMTGALHDKVDCDVIVALFTRDSLRSTSFKGTAAHAFHGGKLICVLLESVDVPAPFNTVQHMRLPRDAKEGHPALMQLEAAVERKVGLRKAAQGELDVFLSYAKADIEQVKLIAQVLQSFGLRVWYDAQINTGEDWSQEIETNLDKAAIIVAFWTAASVTSKWVRAEALLAHDSSRLLSVVLQDFEEPLPPFCGYGGAHDLTSFDNSAENESLLKLVSIIGLNLELPGFRHVEKVPRLRNVANEVIETKNWMVPDDNFGWLRAFYEHLDAVRRGGIYENTYSFSAWFWRLTKPLWMLWAATTSKTYGVLFRQMKQDGQQLANLSAAVPVNWPKAIPLDQVIQKLELRLNRLDRMRRPSWNRRPRKIPENAAEVRSPFEVLFSLYGAEYDGSP